MAGCMDWNDIGFAGQNMACVTAHARRRWQRQRHRRSRSDAGTERDLAGGVGAPEHVARACLDSHMFGARRQAEHDQHRRLFACDQRRQLLIDCLIGHAKNVPHATNARSGGVAPARQLEGQRLAGIERSSGKRPEAGDEDGSGHSTCAN